MLRKLAVSRPEPNPRGLRPTARALAPTLGPADRLLRGVCFGTSRVGDGIALPHPVPRPPSSDGPAPRSRAHPATPACRGPDDEARRSASLIVRTPGRPPVWGVLTRSIWEGGPEGPPGVPGRGPEGPGAGPGRGGAGGPPRPPRAHARAPGGAPRAGGPRGGPGGPKIGGFGQDTVYTVYPPKWPILAILGPPGGFGGMALGPPGDPPDPPYRAIYTNRIVSRGGPGAPQGGYPPYRGSGANVQPQTPKSRIPPRYPKTQNRVLSPRIPPISVPTAILSQNSVPKSVPSLSRLGELLNTQKNVHAGLSRPAPRCPGGPPGTPAQSGGWGVGRGVRGVPPRPASGCVAGGDPQTPGGTPGPPLGVPGTPHGRRCQGVPLEPQVRPLPGSFGRPPCRGSEWGHPHPWGSGLPPVRPSPLGPGGARTRLDP